MSLDVSLYGPLEEQECRECGHVRQVKSCVFAANTTHNLNKMAGEAGIYKHVWRPEEIDITNAKDLIEPLRQGIARMKADPAHYRKFDSPNGWGLYENFVPWLERYLEACEQYPDAEISVSR